MLENKEQEKIAGIISDFFDGAVNEADIDILAMKIYEKYVAKLEQDLEFTTKTANELIEIKHKLEQKLAELKEKTIVPKFSSGQIVYFANIVEGTVNKFNYIGEDKYNYVVEDKTGEVFIRMKERTFATEQEAQTKLKEIQGNE